MGVWSREPLHNWASHGADAWRQFAQGWNLATGAANDAERDEPKRKRNRNWKTA